MDFSISLLLLSFGCVSCERCSDTLHEALKKGFSFPEECGECVTMSPGISSEGKTWAGFCSGDKLFLFQDWKCREDKDLLNKTDYVVLEANELCELVDENHALNQECLKKFNSEICSELSGPEDLECRDVKYRVDEVSFHNLTRTDPIEAFLRRITETTATGTQSVRAAEVKCTNGTTIAMSSTAEVTNATVLTTITSTTWATSTTPPPPPPTTTTPPPPPPPPPPPTTTTTPPPPTTTTTTTTTTTPISTALPSASDCELKEFFFNGHCYFIRHYWDDRTDIHDHARKEFLTNDISIYDVNKCCRHQHPKALGLAVETKEENDFVLRTVRNLPLENRLRGSSLLASLRIAGEEYWKSVILTSGIRFNRSSFLVDEWQGWNLKINRSVLNLKEADRENYSNYYSIDPGNGSWTLINYLKPVDKNILAICERPYNPKNTLLDLHKTCLKEYRRSGCYNSKKHTNFCCAKDDKGVIWFSCPNEIQSKSLDGNECAWACENEGFFKDDRPVCKGRLMCYRTYEGIKYGTVATRYAISDCPKGFRGFSSWYCSSNGTFVGRPDYSSCCEGTVPQCKDTDALLNVWVGCPSKITSKKITCPPGSLTQKALAEWYCNKNGSFSGSSPDFSNCNHAQTTCVQVDRFNREWRAPLNTIQEKICPPTFVGSCFWKCETNGKFDGPEPDCSKCKAEWMEKIHEKIKNDSKHEEVMEIMENYTETEDLRVGYGYVLNLTTDCVALFKRQIPEEDGIKAFDKFLKSYSKILKNIAANLIFWSSFSVTNRGEYAKQILNTTQNAAFAVLSSNIPSQDKYNVTLAKSEAEGFDFFVAYNPSVGSRFPMESFSESDWYLDIKKINESNPTLAAMGLVMNYTLSSLMFPSGIETEDLAMNAPSITFTVAGVVNGDVVFDPNVVVSISFKHQNRTKFPATQVIQRRLHPGEQRSGVFNSTFCCYYRNSNWSTEGCSVTYSSKDRTNCTCNHLSTIGLLMSIHKYVPNTTLELLSTLSSSITIISLILALLVFYFLDNAKNDRVFIGKNLCFCLLVGHFMLITVLDKKFFNTPENLCRVCAVLLHFVFMAAFAWMFVEGCHLYRMLVLVFDSGIEYRRIYLMIGYGVPSVVVGMTALIGFLSQEEPYGQDEFCWLKPPNYVWAFMGPVVVTTSVSVFCMYVGIFLITGDINLCILVTATKLTIASRRRIQKSNAYAPKSLFGGEKGFWLKGWISLSTLLGITWFFGLAYIHYNEAVAYVFVLFNGLQGFFIFLFRCALCEQYKNMFLKKMKTWFFKSKSANHNKNETAKSETKLYAISAMKSSSAKMEMKDSGCDPGSDRIEDNKVKLDKAEVSSTENCSEINTPAALDDFLRSRMTLGKSNGPSDSDNFPELSYHNIYHPN